MLPPFDPASGNLPPGIHEATWEEIAERFGWNAQRRTLLAGLHAALEALRDAGCEWVYIDGSFVTAKELPNDFDACWERYGVDLTVLDPVLLNFRNRRSEQKAKYRGELFFAEMPATPYGVRYLEFFQRDQVSTTVAPTGISRNSTTSR